jgi:DNA replication licensing factor MCM5
MNSGIGYVRLYSLSAISPDGYQTIAKHVMNIHMNRPNSNAGENGEVVGEIDLDKMKRYISYCKSYVAVALLVYIYPNDLNLRKCAPRLSPDAQEMLSSHFVGLRKQVQQVEQDNDERSSIPITIRSVQPFPPTLCPY